MARFEVYERSDHRWAWRLTAGNNEVVATDGGQGYENRSDAEESGRKVVSGGYGAAVDGGATSA